MASSPEHTCVRDIRHVYSARAATWSHCLRAAELLPSAWLAPARVACRGCAWRVRACVCVVRMRHPHALCVHVARHLALRMMDRRV